MPARPVWRGSHKSLTWYPWPGSFVSHWTPQQQLWTIDRYVGFEANLRKSAVFLSAGRRSLPGRLDVCQSLVLADDMFRDRTGLPRGRSRGASETSRLSSDRSPNRPINSLGATIRRQQMIRRFPDHHSRLLRSIGADSCKPAHAHRAKLRHRL